MTSQVECGLYRLIYNGVAEWKQDEVVALLNEIQCVLPNDDNVKYSTMADRLEWDKVKVGQHTPAECKEQWISITTKVDLTIVRRQTN